MDRSRALELGGAVARDAELLFNSSSDAGICKPWTGEIAIRWAVLVNAIESFRRSSHPVDGPTLVCHHQDKRWFYAEDRAWPFSFLNICDAIGVDPTYVRRSLLQNGAFGS